MTEIEFGKTFYPSEEEFSNFKKYIDYLEKKENAANLYGTIKIIPPKSFKAKSNNLKKDYLNDIENLTLEHPYEQNIYEEIEGYLIRY